MDDLRAKQPETRTVEFCMDHDLAERLVDARIERDRLKREAGRRHVDERAAHEAEARAEEAEQEYLELAEQAKPKLIRFVFAAVDPETYDRLKAEHRPTERQRTEARKQNQDLPEWNVETFPPALVAASCIKVTGPSGEQDGLSIEEAQAIWKADNWNSAERAELGNAAMAAYLTRTRLDLPPKAG